MTDNRVMKLWTAIVTAFLALCTALGLITTTAATAAAQTGPARSAESFGAPQEPARPTASSSTWLWSQARSLPPTMKQRIRAEAHGKSPSCRHHGLPDTEAAEHPTSCTPEDPAEPAVPQQN
ncbi:hypothetical protein QFZ66_004390 [Streptomyces sp. B4I13]|uniref:Secreted protein n=1 Tax=Streptomyces achromogenes TaxID=67255 RepID=A0ABU0Q2X2_STRAH|nr:MULTISPECIES: DUF6344 domain-containing protein [Streptomyces]MDQ0685002.1 hypothetical protein [Streptomyces achromogenes]MDQ0832176.1 hypothetical protein [Streptomyces achromogenes]MDQ0960512.1 hypothetical protein [Streptomyces sp. B4I13]